MKLAIFSSGRSLFWSHRSADYLSLSYGTGFTRNVSVIESIMHEAYQDNFVNVTDDIRLLKVNVANYRSSPVSTDASRFSEGASRLT